jgi:hypothetical protein
MQAITYKLDACGFEFMSNTFPYQPHQDSPINQSCLTECAYACLDKPRPFFTMMQQILLTSKKASSNLSNLPGEPLMNGNLTLLLRLKRYSTKSSDFRSCNTRTTSSGMPAFSLLERKIQQLKFVTGPKMLK